MSDIAKRICCATLLAVVSFAARPASANDIIAEWTSVKVPPAPELKSVTIDPKTTALLVLDMMKGNCGVRPRCGASVPAVKKLLDAARAHNMLVAHNWTGQNPKPEDVVDQNLAARPGELLIANGRGADKFIDSTNLLQALKDNGIKTVIVTGTSAQGAVSGTSNGAAQRGFKAVVPVDGMSSENAFNELYAAWHLAKGGPAALVNNVTLTRSDMIKFGN